MDLMNLIPKSETIVVELLNPSDYSPLNMSIEVYAPHTAEYKKASHEQQNRRLNRMQKAKKTSMEIDVAELERDEIELMAKVTKSWNIEYDGQNPPELTVDKAKEVYDTVFWIRPQIMAAWNESLDFTKL
jgi:hypothetical protein